MESRENNNYTSELNVLRNRFLTKKTSEQNNSVVKLSSNILQKGKRHPIVKKWMTERKNRNEKPYNFLTRRNNLWRGKKRSNFSNSKINITKYNTVLGSGGFGMIISEPSGMNVVKLFYTKDTCGEMAKEYESFVTAYNALEDNPFPQISIPEPKKLDNRNISFKAKSFQCGIEMKRVQPIPIMADKKNGMIHIILKEENKRMMNREVGRKYGSPPSEENPSRGFFATGSYIESDILPSLKPEEKIGITTIGDIAFRLGYSFALLVAYAELYPNDVEYCLGLIDGIVNVVIMDFGMCIPIDYTQPADSIVKMVLHGNGKNVHSTGISADLYFPYSDDPTFPKFAEGINYVKSKLTDATKIEVLNKLIESF